MICRETGYDDTHDRCDCGEPADEFRHGLALCAECADQRCATAGCDNEWAVIRPSGRYCEACDAASDAPSDPYLLPVMAAVFGGRD